MQPAAGEPLLVASGLTKRYRRRTVVKDVSFTVRGGEIVGLLGPNGAGKTTSFNIVAGLVRADAGSVRLLGRELGSLPLYRRARLGLGYLPQESTVFRGLTARQNLAAVGPTGQRAAQRVEALLAAYQLQAVAETLGAELSGGERRRLEMARALVGAPKVLLLDEPFAGVDPIAVAEIRRFIREVCEAGIGVLITDHSVRDTLRICSRAYLMHAGSIVLSGPPAAIVADPMARQLYLGDDFNI